jgi:hypothetical protein
MSKRRVPPPESETLEGDRLVHNFYPGPHDDPGLRHGGGLLGFRTPGVGFRWWLAYADDPLEERCHCGWLEGREHYSTGGHVDEDGVRRRDEKRPPLPKGERLRLAQRAARADVAYRAREADRQKRTT